MKYSLATKEFRKRNNIFGERRHQYANQEPDQADLQSIKELGSDLQDSTVNHQHLLTNAHSRKSNSKEANILKTQSVLVGIRESMDRLKKSSEGRVGRHGLSPNVKPEILVSLPSKSAFACKGRKELRLQSKVVNFQYFCQGRQVQLVEMKQLIQTLYSILCRNNEKIQLLESLLLMLHRSLIRTDKQLHFSLSHSLRLDSKVDLFLNTMRNVYQNLRISRLKQQNLQLQFNHCASQGSSVTSKVIMRKEGKCIENIDLMSLLQYQSQSSILHQRREKDKYTPIQHFKQKSTFHNESQVQVKTLQEQQTHSFRREENHYERLSPFEANRLISNNSVKSFYYDSSHPHERGQPKTKEPARPQLNYSFQRSQKEKIVAWLVKRGEEGMGCWVDDMGCLRRANNTYVFWGSGEVVRVSGGVFGELLGEGWVRRCGEE